MTKETETRLPNNLIHHTIENTSSEETLQHAVLDILETM
jgi:hypothetical protein